jgi:serine/threonine protein phosphatase PrpC
MEDRSTAVGSLLAAATGTSPSKSPRSRSPAPDRSLGPDFAFAAIYDGHNGDDVAEQLKQEFHRIVYNRLRAQCSEPSENLESLLAAAIETACREMDERILSKEHAIQQDLWLQAEDDDDPRALVSRVQSSAGATCAFAVVVPEGLHASSKARFLAVANVGDSRVVLSVDGNATNLTSDHKPTREDEKQRIEQAGGWVHKGRLGGILAVSRAFGDSAYKTYPSDDLWGAHQQLISRPGVQVLEIADDFEFVIIASDGLWDVLPSELAVNYVRRRLAYHGDVQRATTELITKAEELGTGDNVSAVICCLNQVKQQSRPFGASKTTIFGSSKQNMTLTEPEKQRQSSTNSSSSERTALLAAEPVPRHEEKTPGKARRASLTALLKGGKSDDASGSAMGDDGDAQLISRHSTSSSTKPKKGVLGLFGKSGAKNG